MSIAWKTETRESAGSTQDILKELAEKGAPEGTVVQALEQTAGRGRHGRKWVSEKGNLYLSVLLRPGCPAREAGLIALLAGLAVASAVRPYAPPVLKWPNDVLLEGKKCAGILLDTALDGDDVKWAAVGIGVNIASAPAGAACLNDYADVSVVPEVFRDEVLNSLSLNYVKLKEEGGGDVPLRGSGAEEIRQEWLELAHKEGTPVSVRIGETVREGAFGGLDYDGSLLLRDRSGDVVRITAGDVYF